MFLLTCFLKISRVLRGNVIEYVREDELKIYPYLEYL